MDKTNRRRRDMMKMLAAGGAAGLSGWIAQALAKGDVPPGINRLEGTATVNARPAQVGTPVQLGDRIATGRGSQAVIVVGSDAFLLRSQTVIEVKGREGVLSDLLVASGQVLSVFAKKPVAIKAATASIGIRGTGAYIEVHPDSVYFCLCYGEALVEGPGMAGAKLVKTTHHEQPLVLRDDGGHHARRARALPQPQRRRVDPARVAGGARAALHEGRDVPGEAILIGIATARAPGAGRKGSSRSFRKRRPFSVGRIVAWSRASSPALSASPSSRSITVIGNPVRRAKSATGNPSISRSALSMNSNGSSASSTSRDSWIASPCSAARRYACGLRSRCSRTMRSGNEILPCAPAPMPR